MISSDLSHKKTERFYRVAIHWAVAFTGAAIMVIELLGTRIIAPFYGASLYVWTSIISVTMIALAAGYYVGGKLSDRTQGFGISLVIGVGGFLVILIPVLSSLVLIHTNSLGLRTGSFVSAFILFTPSLLSLAMTGPFAIKLMAQQLSGVGSSVGSIYAVSTVGSVLGTVFLGFVLFPMLGSRAILFGTGFLLLTLALLFSFDDFRTFGRKLTPLWVSLLILLAVFLFLGDQAFKRSVNGTGLTLKSEKESLYGWVRVLEDTQKDLRILANDASVIGADMLSTGETRLHYQILVDLLPQLYGGIQKVLLIGQGAGHIAVALERNYGVEVDSIEIDPAVADAAEKQFNFRSKGRKIVGDARYEISKLNGEYDLIIHDCFTGGAEPTHLLTVETFDRLRGLLSEHGLVVLNTVALFEKGQNPALSSIVKTFDHTFPYHHVYRVMDETELSDFVMVGAKQPLKPVDTSQNFELSQWFEQKEVEVDVTKGVLLTDDFNPLADLQLEKSEAYRKLVVEWLGTDLMTL